MCNYSGRELWAVSGLAMPFLEAICNLTCNCAMRLSGDEDKTWFSDTFGHLLAAWVSLASVGSFDQSSSPLSLSLSLSLLSRGIVTNMA